jgi:hypothetical protein
MKELLEKLTKRTEETNAALQVNSALTKEGNASLRVQSQLAQAQDDKLKSLVNITKAGLLGDQRDKQFVRLQEDLAESRRTKRDSFQKDAEEKSFSLREKAKELQEKAISVSESSLSILRFNVFNDIRRRIAGRKAAQILANRSKLMAQTVIDIRSFLQKDGKTNLELLKSYKDPTEKSLLRKSAEGIASLVKFSKDGETRSPTLKLIKYFKDKDKRDAIAAKEKRQEAIKKAVNDPNFAKNLSLGKAPKKGFFLSMRNFFAMLGAWKVALLPILKSAGALFGAKALAGLKFFGKRFFVLGAIIAAFDGIKDAIKAFGDTEGNFGEKLLAAIGEFTRTFVADIIGGTVEALKWVGLKIAEFFGADTDGELFSALENWSAVDAVKELFDGVVNALTEFIVGLAGGVMDGFNAFGEDANILLKISGAIGGFFIGMTTGFVDMLAELLGSIISADPMGGEDTAQMFKDFSLKDWFLDSVIPFFTETITNAIGEFMYNIKQKFLDFIKEKIAEPMVMGSIGVNNWLREFVQSQLPDRKGKGVLNWIGKTIIPDGIYDWAFGKPASEKEKTSTDANKAIPDKKETPKESLIPQVKRPSLGQRLMEAGSNLARSVVNVVNNNGGNVSNTTTSSQVNNTRTSSPIMMGSMGAY